MRPLRLLALTAFHDGNQTMSYQRGYPLQLARSPLFEVKLCNLASLGRLDALSLSWDLRFSRYDAIVLLHSVFSNSCFLTGRLLDLVCRARLPKAFFIGNEYKLMPEKMAFAEAIGAAVLVTQMNHPRTLAVYRERLPACSVLHLPNTGIDPQDYTSDRPYDDRPVDLGYRGNGSVLYLGNDEREQLAAVFALSGPANGLTVDISTDPTQRYAPREWVDFLYGCKGQIGNEPGGDYFELTDATRKAVNALLATKPDAGLDEIHAAFFANYQNPVPGRIIGSRQIEAAATKTVQILFEGEYGGYLQPHIHYIPLKKDFSNLGEVIRQFRDKSEAERIRSAAYEQAMDCFTYDKLFAKLRDTLRAHC